MIKSSYLICIISLCGITATPGEIKVRTVPHDSWTLEPLPEDVLDIPFSAKSVAAAGTLTSGEDIRGFAKTPRDFLQHIADELEVAPSSIKLVPTKECSVHAPSFNVVIQNAPDWICRRFGTLVLDYGKAEVSLIIRDNHKITKGMKLLSFHAGLGMLFSENLHASELVQVDYEISSNGKICELIIAPNGASRRTLCFKFKDEIPQGLYSKMGEIGFRDNLDSLAFYPEYTWLKQMIESMIRVAIAEV